MMFKATTISAMLLSFSQVYAQSASLQGHLLASTPKGWVQFCEDVPSECTNFRLPPQIMKLDKELYSLLKLVNDEVNRSIKQVSDKEQYGIDEYWAYPTSGKGDCEDIVLEKKRRLEALGLAKSALLITIVRDLKNEGHAVLTVRTDKGDVILDNQNTQLKLWHQTGYQFIKRQAEENPNQWLALGVGAANSVASTGR